MTPAVSSNMSIHHDYMETVLVVHVPLHGEADLLRFIRDGIPGTAMAPQGNALGEEQIWHVVNYIRTLEE